MTRLDRTTSFFAIASLGAITLFGALFPSSAGAVPGYARQTGLDCNSCHIGFNPVPLFTRTGRLFLLRGYTQPDSIQGELRQTGFDSKGEETPEYGGNYLSLNWKDFLSARFVSSLVSDGTGVNGEDRPTESTIGSRIALFFTGPITDWLGIWTEVGYIGNQALVSVSEPTTGNKTNKNYFAYDEIRLTASWMVGEDSFFGFVAGNESPDAHTEFVFPLYQLRPWGYGQGGVGNAFSTTTFTTYGFWKNRWLTQYSASTGDLDASWSDGHNDYFALGYNGLPGTGDRFRRHGNDLWLMAEYMTGENQGSQVNPFKTSLLCPTVCPPGVSDRNLSITNTLGYQGETIADLAQFNGTGIEMVEDFDALRLAVHSIVADWGPHSWYQSLAYIRNEQDYISGASSERSAIGYQIRYFYNRTYGASLYANKDFSYDYRDSAGVNHEAYTHLNWGLGFLWAPAMNLNFLASYSPSHTTVLDRANYQDDGRSFSVTLDYLF